MALLFFKRRQSLLHYPRQMAKKASDMGYMGFLRFSKTETRSYQGLADSSGMSSAIKPLNFQQFFML